MILWHYSSPQSSFSHLESCDGRERGGGEIWASTFKKWARLSIHGDLSLISMLGSNHQSAAINQNSTKMKSRHMNCHSSVWQKSSRRMMLLTGTLCVVDVQGVGGLRWNAERSACCDRSDSHGVAAVFDNFSHSDHPRGYKTVLDAYRRTRGVNTVSCRDYEDIKRQGQKAG